VAETNAQNEQQQAVANVAKHHSEEEWKRHTGEDRWVNFLVHWDSVSVCDLLEHKGKFVCLEDSWRLDIVVVVRVELDHVRSLNVFFVSIFQFF